MPRKHPRPAAKKRAAKVAAKVASRNGSKRRVVSILAPPHHNDRLKLAAMAYLIQGNPTWPKS